MHETSQTYKDILFSGNYRFETALSIGEGGRLATEKGEVIRFGGDAILISASDADGGYGENILISCKTQRNVFPNNVPEVGGCTAGEIYVEMLMPVGTIERMARVTPYVRLVSQTDPNLKSEWIKKGVFYIDTRENTNNDDDLDILTFHGYDAMLKANELYTPRISFPANDLAVVRDIATQMEVDVASETVTALNMGYPIQLPVQYTKREILGYIGGVYAGNWIINDDGELQLIFLNGIPEETSLLIEENGFYLTFGGDRIKL